METETEAPTTGVTIRVHSLDPSSLVVETTGRPFGRMDLDRATLQELVQQAYDRFGILATPSLEREAERGAELPDVAGMIRGHVAAAQAQQLLNSTVTP